MIAQAVMASAEVLTSSDTELTMIVRVQEAARRGSLQRSREERAERLG
jgi:hypothetical protein